MNRNEASKKILSSVFEKKSAGIPLQHWDGENHVPGQGTSGPVPIENPEWRSGRYPTGEPFWSITYADDGFLRNDKIQIIQNNDDGSFSRADFYDGTFDMEWNEFDSLEEAQQFTPERRR